MSGMLGVARGALLAHQTALQTISHNIANAETPGYSRQEVVLSATVPTGFTFGYVGTGVEVSTIVRKRDQLLDNTYRIANGGAGEADMRRDLLTGLEGIFGEPTDAGMSASLDAFFSAWSDLAATPSSLSARAVVQQRGRAVAQLFNNYDTGLSQERSSAMNRLANTVAKANQLAVEVADLNGRIISAENMTDGGTAGELRDQRDRALDQLSTLVGARVVDQSDGSVTVLVGNSTLVDGTSARPLSMELAMPVPPPSTPLTDVPIKIRLGSGVDALYPIGGEMHALVSVLNTTIPDLRGRLDAMASSLASTVNAAHTQGYTFSGTTLPGTAAGNFFDPGTVTAPVSAASIRLDLLVGANANAIAASADPMAPLDNQTALAMAALRGNNNTVSYTSGSVTQTGSYLGFFRSAVTNLGLDVNRAADDATVQNVLSSQADIRRQSVSGVNTDEELVNLLRVQQAYTAATKLIKVADEMLQTVLTLI